MKRLRAAFVVQRYGIEVNGGAETLCRSVAERMARHWDVDVLTSCSRDYVSRFENDYAPGTSAAGGVQVHRFRVDWRRSEDRVFAALDAKVVSRASSVAEDQLWLKEVGPYCEGLLRFVDENVARYDVFIFFTYLYATTTLAMPRVRQKALFVPTAHDETPMRARPFDELFAMPRLLLCSTVEELDFLKRRTGGRLSPAEIVGGGVDLPLGATPELFRRTFGIEGPFVLYVGRIQKEKCCDELFAHYQSLPDELKLRAPLVLIGKAAMPIPASPYIRSLGFVDDALKASALKAASLLVLPSRFESLSLAVMEAWVSGIPVLVNGQADVLQGHCRRSHGGLWYANRDEFEAALLSLMAPGAESLRTGLARNGARYVDENYSWAAIEKKYLALADRLSGDPQPVVV